MQGAGGFLIDHKRGEDREGFIGFWGFIFRPQAIADSRCGHTGTAIKEHLGKISEIRHRMHLEGGEEGLAKICGRLLKQAHRWHQQSALATALQIARGFPGKGLRGLVETDRFRLLMSLHPFPHRLIVLTQLAGTDGFPRWIANDPIKALFPPVGTCTLFAYNSLAKCGLDAEEVMLDQIGRVTSGKLLGVVCRAQSRQLERVHGAGEVRRVHVVEQCQQQAELGDLAGILIHITAKDGILQQFAKLCRLGLPLIARKSFLNEQTISLHQKRSRSAAGIKHLHALFQRVLALQLCEHEVHQRQRRVVRAFLAAFGFLGCGILPGVWLLGVQKLLIHERECLDGNKREIVRPEIEMCLRAASAAFFAAEGTRHRLNLPNGRRSFTMPCKREDLSIQPFIQFVIERCKTDLLGLRTENIISFKVPLGQTFVRQDAAIPQVAQIHILADQSVGHVFRQTLPLQLPIQHPQ